VKGLRKILRVSWTATKTNKWVFNEAGVKRELLDTVKARKLAYYGHTIKKQRSCLEKEIMQGTMPCVRRRGRQNMGPVRVLYPMELMGKNTRETYHEDSIGFRVKNSVDFLCRGAKNMKIAWNLRVFI